MKLKGLTLLLAVFTSQMSFANQSFYIDTGVGAAAGVAGQVAQTILLPITATVSCLNHTLEICRPEAAFVRLVCKTTATSRMVGLDHNRDEIITTLTASYMDEDRNEMVLPDQIIWSLNKFSRIYSDIDTSFDGKETNELVDQLDLQCRSMLNSATHQQASGHTVRE